MSGVYFSMNFDIPRWRQCLLPLTQTVITERGHSLVCIPDRTTAECELEKLRREYSDRLARAVIRKTKPGKRGTYTLRYFTHDTETVPLF
jgi:hypothetical protein